MLYSAGILTGSSCPGVCYHSQTHIWQSQHGAHSLHERACVSVCNKEIYVYVRNSEKRVGGQKQMSLFEEKCKECDSEDVCAWCVCKHVCPSVFFCHKTMC